MRKLPPHLVKARKDVNNYRMMPIGFLPTWTDRTGFVFERVMLIRSWHKDCELEKPTEHAPRQISCAPRPSGEYMAVDCDCPDRNDKRRGYRRCRHMEIFDYAGELLKEVDEENSGCIARS